LLDEGIDELDHARADADDEAYGLAEEVIGPDEDEEGEQPGE